MITAPQNEVTAKRIGDLWSYIAKDKPKKLRDGFTPRPLERGWLLPYLLGLDDMTWQRWEHWARITEAGRIGDAPIPQIEWATHRGEGSTGWKMYDRCLNEICRSGGWGGWSASTYMDYFLDWLLFAFGDPSQKELPAEPHGCEGAHARLYQLFNLEPLLAYPSDYLGDIMAMANFGRGSGFFPTPHDICELMIRMQFHDAGDLRTKTVMDPCVGTGRMLLSASNYSYRLYGQDINRTVIKACLVNGYLYSPWLVKPFDFLDTYNEFDEPEPHLKEIAAQEVNHAPVVGQLELLNA